jgi:PAS domain S-box-containing protein
MSNLQAKSPSNQPEPERFDIRRMRKWLAAPDLREVSAENEELRRANKEAQLSTQRMRTMFAALPDGLGITDTGGVLLEANQSLARLAGVDDPAQLLGRKATDLVATSDRERALQNFASGKMVGLSVEYRMARFDGREFDGELTAAILTDEQGQPAGFVTVVRDITAQKQATEQLRRMQVIVENTPDFIAMASPTGKGLYINPAGLQMIGYSAKEFAAGMNIGSVQPGLPPEAFQSAVVQGQWIGESELVCKDGRRIPVSQVIAAVKDERGQFVALTTIARDISVEKQAQAELQFRSQFERLVADISTQFVSLAGNLDEQITTTLQSIGEFSGLDRSYVFRTHLERGTMDNTHEWCAPGITPHKDDLQGLPLDTFPWLMAQLRNQQTVYIPHVADLPAEASAEKTEFEREAIQSLIVVPMIYQGELVGFVGFDSVQKATEWTEYTSRLLRMVADGIAGALQREQYGVELERRVAERTAAMEKTNLYLALATEIGQNISQVRELDVMLRDAAEIIRAFFGMYYVQVYLVNPAQTELVLQFGTGEVGAELLARRHRLPLDANSINGRAALTRRSVVIADTAASPTFRPNPLLPNTRSEMAVPLLVGDQLIGVLDMQSEQPGALAEDALLAFEPLSGQFAVAIQNARLRQEMTMRLNEVDSISRALSAEAWRAYQSNAADIRGFVYDQNELQPQPAWPPALALAAQETRTLTPQETGEMAAMPLTVRGGEVIGALGVFDDPQNPLSTEDLNFIEQVSEQLSLALESARLFDQTQTTLAQTETLYEIGRLLNNAANVDEILEAVSLPARQAGCHDAMLVYFDLDANDQPEAMTIMAAWRVDGREAMPVGLKTSLLQSPLTPLLSAGPAAPRLIPSVATEQSLPPNFKAMMMQAGNAAMAIVPIAQVGRWLGLITFGWPAPHTFSQAESDTYNALIGLAAPAVQSRRLLIQAQSRAQREQALRQITSAVRSSTDPAIIMRTAVREIGNILGRKALIRLEEPEVARD